MKKLNIAILASGRGSVILDLLEEVKKRNLPVELKIIISDKPDAKVLELAKNLGIKNKYVSKENKTREKHEDII